MAGAVEVEPIQYEVDGTSRESGSIGRTSATP